MKSRLNLTLSTAVFAILLVTTSCKVYFPPTIYHQVGESTPYDAMIVPGYPFDTEKKNYLMKSRVLWAKHLYDMGFCKNLIFSGGAVYSPYYESQIMALYAEELGVPSENIFVENEAEHTTENLFNSYKMAEEMGFEKVGFATDVYQTTFIAAYLKKLNMEHVDLIPMRFSLIDTFKEVEMVAVDYDLAKKEDFESILLSQTKQERKNRSNGALAVE